MASWEEGANKFFDVYKDVASSWSNMKDQKLFSKIQLLDLYFIPDQVSIS